MASKLTMSFAVLVITIIINRSFVEAEPAIAMGFDPMEICIENCAQCKKMLGSWFEGPLCAESCIRHRGKLIPDCEDFASIAPFLTKI
ncbi:unnamed protein product, partial [Iphiclides podalirius]